MSAASIDRYLAPAKASDQIRGVSTTKPSPLLRSSIKIRKAGAEEVPFAVTGLDFDNGTEFLNKAVIKWAGDLEQLYLASFPTALPAVRKGIRIEAYWPLTPTSVASIFG